MIVVPRGPRDTLPRRFWSKVDKRSADECWLWTGATRRGDYGHISRGRRGDGSVGAHVLSFELAHGALPAGCEVCHSCDNPPCCNPAHLFAGTRSANMLDAGSKGRLRLPDSSGIANGNARLTTADVAAIRGAAGTVPQRELAHRYGVSKSTISAVVCGETWA